MIEKDKSKYFFALFFVGVVNNNGYTLVQAAASDLAKPFHQESFMGMFLFCMIFCGAISRVVNGSCCVHVRHKTRALIVAIFTISSFIMIAFACINDNIPFMFWVAVGASVF